MASSSDPRWRAGAVLALTNWPDDDAFFLFPPHSRHYPSQSHVAELAASSVDSEQVVEGWLIRSLVLTDRLLPIITHDVGWQPQEVVQGLRETAGQLGISINPELYPDLLNPFLYAPEKLDHAVAALLAVLVRTWDLLASSSEGGSTVFWVSDEVRAALIALATRPPTDAEAIFLKGRDAQGKPNRLGALLDRTPQELAMELMDRASHAG